MYRILIQRSCGGLNASKNTTTAFVRRLNSTQVPFVEAGFGKFLFIISPFAIGGGVISYANYDKEFRKLLVTNVPAIEPVLEVFLDDSNPLADVQKKFEEYSAKMNEYTSYVKNLFGSDDKAKTDDVVKPMKKPEAPKPFAYTTTSTPKSSATKGPEVTSSVPAPQLSKPQSVTPVSAPKQQTVSKVESKPQIEIPSNIVELEKAVEVAALVAVKEYNKAVNVLKAYNEDVKKIVDSAVEQVDINSWTALKNKTLNRDNAVQAAEEAAAHARKRLEELEKSLDKNIMEVSNDVKNTVKKNIDSFNDHLNAAKLEVMKAKELSSTSENYWKKVETARGYFVNEIESLFGVNLGEKKMDLSKDEVDLFLINAYSHVTAYQKELQKLQTEGELRLRRALDAVRGSDQSESVKAQLEYELEKERRNLNLQNQAKIIKIKAETEKQLREQLKKQIEAHADHLNDAVSQKEAEMKRLFARELDEKIASERASYNSQLASMLGKLKGMDSALKERADAEKSAHQAQSLWAACQSLWSSVRSGQPGKTWREELRPLNSEIKAVGSAAEGDELVAVVLNSLPDAARERGVYPEEALRERFVNVDRVARRLALVPAEGASLPVYLLSFIQSALIATPSEPITKDELEDQEFDFSKLDTYDILNRARYWLDRGNLVQTLKYMNLLQGASRKVSNEWLSEARLLLETQQACNVLIAHASANGSRFL